MRNPFQRRRRWATIEQSRSNRAAGFTLIELLIIMVILGILATIIIFAVQSLEGESNVASCKADFKTIETAQETYRSQVGRSATSFAALLTTTTGMTGTPVGPWLRDLPASSHGYVIGFDLNPGTNFGNITVTAGTHGPSDGAGNCQYAG